MKVLVCGGSGLVGRNLINLLEHEKIETISTCYSRPSKNGYQVNFSDESEITLFLQTHKPTVVVNCIVERYTDVCEKFWDRTKAINIDLVDRLSKICAKENIYFIHISTDYVFDGKEGKSPFSPTSEVNPLQNYGISKLISELRVKGNCSEYAILRVPVLYCDDCETLEENAITVIGKKVLNQSELTTEDNDSIRRPVYIPDFCKFILSFILTSKVGTFHFYNPITKTTKYQMAKQIAEILGVSDQHISPAKSSPLSLANRPFDTQLTDPSYDIYSFQHTPFTQVLERCFQKWKHPSFFSGELFILMDLDGTLIDSDPAHFEAYRKTFKNQGRELTWEEFEHAIHFTSIEELYKQKNFKNYEFELLKKMKKEYFKQTESISFLPGAEQFLQKCLEQKINFVIVTNTSREIVEFIQTKLPLLHRCRIITREDYKNPKPDPECYRKAKELYWKGEKYIVGFENTVNGYKALKEVSNIQYFISQKPNKEIKKEDIYIIPDFQNIK